MDSKTLCLGALTMGDASGYEIKKMFEEGCFAHFHDTNFGSIYPALRKLLDDKLVTYRDVPQEGRPDKKEYSLTEEGGLAFKAALKKAPAKDKIRSEHTYMMFFADYMDLDALEDVFESYLTHYRQGAEAVRELDNEGASPSRIFIRGMGLAFYDAIEKYMEENKHLLLDQQPSPNDKGVKL